MLLRSLRLFVAVSTAAAGFAISALSQHSPALSPTNVLVHASGMRSAVDAHRSLGTPAVYRNLSIIPVYDDRSRSAGTYITLDDGLASGTVSVHESKSGGDVNTLYVTNKGKKPVYLMGGEVVLGGQQDRCLGRDTIVKAKERDVPVTVFCVEHGRWAGHTEFAQAAPSLASADVRSKAQDAEFYGARDAVVGSTGFAGAVIGGTSSNQIGGRVANTPMQSAVGASSSSRVSKAQQKVWDTVAQKNAKLNTGSATGTYRVALTLSGGDAQKSVPGYLKALAGGLGQDPHLVGVVAAINGKVIAADIFSDPTLFQKLWPKLLRSFAADAVESSSQSPKPIAMVTPVQAKAFLLASTDVKSRTENRSDFSTNVRYESINTVTFSLETPQNGASGGGFGAVHTGTIVK